MRYDDQLLARMRDRCPDSMVAGLCRADNERSAAWGRTIEAWSERVPLSAASERRLLGCDDDQWWSTFFELLAGRLLMEQGFVIESEPEIGGLTPDWLVTDDTGRYLVEVLGLLPTWESKTEERRRVQLEAALADGLELPRGQVSVMLQTAAPLDPAEVHEVRSQLRAWFDGGVTDRLMVESGRVVFTASHLPSDIDGVLVVQPLGKALQQGPRLTSRLRKKVHKYGDLVTTGELGLIVFVGTNFWEVRHEDVGEALYGPLELTFNRTNPDDYTLAHSGDGVASAVAPIVYETAVGLQGVYLARVTGSRVDPPGLLVEATFHHNAGTARPLPVGRFAPFREYFVADDRVGWTDAYPTSMSI